MATYSALELLLGHARAVVDLRWIVSQHSLHENLALALGKVADSQDRYGIADIARKG